VKNFAKVCAKDFEVNQFLDSWPKYLKAVEFKKLIKGMQIAKQKGKPIIFMLGAHIIKCGLSPIIIDLMENGFITLMALNGAGAIHDFELAFWGKTSEEVEEALHQGKFGMAQETALFFNQISACAGKRELGLGEGIGESIYLSKSKYKNYSILANAHKLKIPVTVHIALGTDIVHQHPNFDASSVALASHKDFKILAEEVSKMGNGGVVINFGSAVILPEVFLKALSVAINIKGEIKNFITANFDMIQHYRPNVNVVLRPTKGKGEGFSFSGHHEIMLPLLAWGLKAGMRGNVNK
jgi:deoxyhypusine synthase